MERQHVENLSILCLYMEGLHDAGFDMREFYHRCGAPSCALGWATTIPELVKAGLSKSLRHEDIEKVFGDVYQPLFNGGVNAHIKTPQQWANHCRAFLREHGHEVVAPEGETFKRFMNAVLRPVAVNA